MATPPTRQAFVVPATANYTSSTTPKTSPALNIAVGDLLVVTASGESNASPPTVTPSISSGAVTWTLRVTNVGGAAGSGSASIIKVWTGAVTTASASATVSLAAVTSGASFWGFSVTQWRNHGGLGVLFNDNNNTGSSAPSPGATCSANSAIQIGVNDWNAIDGTTRTWRTVNGAPQTESTYVRDSGGTHHTVYGGYTLDVGAAGAKVQGLTAPSTMRWVAAGVEILGTTSTGPAGNFLPLLLAG